MLKDVLPGASMPRMIWDEAVSLHECQPHRANAEHAHAIDTKFDWRKAARQALLSRALDDIEERELTPQGKIKYQFSARGHELGQVLISQLLTHPHDAAAPYYRSRPFLLGCGLSPLDALNNSLANSGSFSGGRDLGVLSSLPKRDDGPMLLPMTGDVGSQFAPAAGYAQGLHYRLTQLKQGDVEGSIVVVFGGEGASATGGFWAGLNIAAAHALPVLFVIEDNGYAISVRSSLQSAGGDIAANLASFRNVQVWDGDGTDPVEAASTIAHVIATMRGGAGAGLLRLRVPRLAGHSSVDNQSYKSQAEKNDEDMHDPLPRLRRHLVPGVLSEREWDALVIETEDEVRIAAAMALSMPEPDPAGATRFVFSERRQSEGADKEGKADRGDKETRRLNMIDAIRRTLDGELASNDRLLIFGEDVGAKGGVHGLTLGLQAKHGEGRVFDTALNEEGIVGRAMGMALCGLMPVPEIQYRKYADAAQEALMTVGTLRWRTAGNFAAPMVVRMAGGFRKVGDPWHSMTNEAAFAHAIGWRVAFPSNAEDAVGLLRAALRGDDPVIFFEHRYCYDSSWARRAYPGDDFVLPFGKARVITPGDRLTVVAWGAMVELCETAARGIDGIEVIDLRTIVPWDKGAVLESVRKTSRCLIVHEDVECAGFGAEIAATVTREAFYDLDAPVERVAAPGTMVPFNPVLMPPIVPTVERIRAAMHRLLKI